MEIKVNEWKMSKSGKSANLFAGSEKYYLPLKKIGLKVGEEVPDFEDAQIFLEKKDLFIKEGSFWIRINRFQNIKLKNGTNYEWQALRKIKQEIFGPESKDEKKTFEFIDPKEW